MTRKKHINKFLADTQCRDNPANLFMFMCFLSLTLEPQTLHYNVVLSGRAIREIDSREPCAIEPPIFIASRADSHESFEFPIRANHATKVWCLFTETMEITRMTQTIWRPAIWRKADSHRSRALKRFLMLELQSSGPLQSPETPNFVKVREIPLRTPQKNGPKNQ